MMMQNEIQMSGTYQKKNCKPLQFQNSRFILQSHVNKYWASTKALIYSFTNESVFSVNAVF